MSAWIQPDLFSQPEPDITAGFHGGNAESQDAHAAIEPSAAAMRESIVKLFRRYKGLTCDEVEVKLKLKHQTASARMSELKREGAIVPTGEKRPTRSGCKAQVFKIAEKA